MKVFISPTYRHKDEKGDGGIRRVSEALWKYLPQFGVEPTDKPEEADLLNLHGAAYFERPGIPIVASCHGLYWSDYKFPGWAHETNRMVTDIMARAQAVTAPSRWVADAISRGMLVRPTICHHGIDAWEWGHNYSHGGYVLWNKARADPVSNPDDVDTLARLMPSQRFVTTLGIPAQNVEIIGTMGFDQMRPVIQRAGVYLATARETFGIGTLEALASGVPVVGWDYGGQHEIIVPGETGYLAPYGDYDALRGCIIRALAERNRLSGNAIADVRKRWAWPDKVERYAVLFKSVWEEWNAPRPKVSVVVTCHDLAKYLPEALDSVLAQTMQDWECIIVDDWSEDDTKSVCADYCAREGKFIYIRTPSNLKLSGARNWGFAHSHGRYIIFLDADDLLERECFSLLSNALDSTPYIHIAYGHLDTMQEDGSGRGRSQGWPPEHYDFHGEMAHLNQLHYSAMMRREVMECGGGYRARSWRAEDAEMWCRLTSFGFRASKVTEASTLIYRFRGDSKSQQELKEFPDRDGDWTAFYPWRLAGTAKEGLRLNKRGARTSIDATPWGAQGKPPEGYKFWSVPHFAQPEISVVIPVGPGHEPFIIDAVESVMAQTFRNWEVIVVNNTGKAWGEGFGSPLCGAPYAKVIHPKKESAVGSIGYARNLGASRARGECLVFLDADDVMLPRFLELTYAEYKNTKRAVYTDCLIGRSDPRVPLEIYEGEDYQCSSWVVQDAEEHIVGAFNRMQHTNCFLIPTWAFKKAGGYNESISGHEDWDLQIRLDEAGVCSICIHKPLLLYRVRTGKRREESEARMKQVKAELKELWLPYYRGEKVMPCGNCPQGSAQEEPMTEFDPTIAEVQKEAVLVEYAGNNVGTMTFTGQVTGAQYSFGDNDGNRVKYVKVADLEWLLGLNISGKALFQLVDKRRAAPHEPLNVSQAKVPPNLPSMEDYAREARAQVPANAQRG